MKFSKEERSWIMYDWADSVFSTIMLASVFPAFFVEMAGGTGGSMWWAFGNSTARFIVGVFAPFVGSLIEFKSYKKRLLVMFIMLGVLFTFATSFIYTWQLLLVGYVFSRIFHAAAFQVYDSFLPDVTTKERMDRVSATAYAFGYIGGSTIPFAISIVLITFGGDFGIGTDLAVRISIVITAVWWGLFSIPVIKNVTHKHEKEIVKGKVFKSTVSKAFETAKKIWRNKGLRIFILGYFLYIDGVGSVIQMATAYGAEIGLSTQNMIFALFVTQIVAFPFSILFGKFAKSIGSINLIITSIIIYFFICIVGFTMGFGLEEEFFGIDTATILFFVLAILVGTVQGGIQSISRSTFGKLIPKEESGSYFGFFEIFSRFAAILGPGIYGLIFSLTGRPSFSILSIITLFFAGLVVMVYGRKHIISQIV
ncbi:MAG: MFS transporter [Defluviitaleaceae bacterium]|nr:MFS transporter [Defluviitaleaceae bacterium]